MKKTKIVLNFSRYADAVLENKAQSIIAAIVLASAIFTNPTPAIAALQAAVKAFGDALIVAADGGRTQVAQKNKCREILEGLLRQLAGYVTMIAGDDKAILTSSGFDLQRPSEPSPDVVSPLVEVVAGVNRGEVDCTVEKIKGAKNYSYECTMDPLTDSSVWQNEPDSRITHVISGLESGKKYWFRVGAIGLRGARAYSNPVSYYIQ